MILQLALQNPFKKKIDFCGDTFDLLPKMNGMTHDPCRILKGIFWPNGIIFHQPRFPWNKVISLTTSPFGEIGRVFGRYNLTRLMSSSKKWSFFASPLRAKGVFFRWVSLAFGEGLFFGLTVILLCITANPKQKTAKTRNLGGIAQKKDTTWGSFSTQSTGAFFLQTFFRHPNCLLMFVSSVLVMTYISCERRLT